MVVDQSRARVKIIQITHEGLVSLTENICMWGLLLFSEKKEEIHFAIKYLAIASARNLTGPKFYWSSVKVNRDIRCNQYN